MPTKQWTSPRPDYWPARLPSPCEALAVKSTIESSSKRSVRSLTFPSKRPRSRCRTQTTRPIPGSLKHSGLSPSGLGGMLKCRRRFTMLRRWPSIDPRSLTASTHPTTQPTNRLRRTCRPIRNKWLVAVWSHQCSTRK